jgi:hypothetical protein
MIVRELVEIEGALGRLTVLAMDLKELDSPTTQVEEGLFISFHQSCRTKNGKTIDVSDVTNYSFERSPLLYSDEREYRFIFPYDPAWITTRTAAATVRREMAASRASGS